jgi:UDP-N-acetylglucosamine--N-acetylmuramyl-(pentapeptide) pyrophosphoryl-undecaprenol N-acetylglucosamine transferase
MMTESRTVILAAGGTGGHLFPAQGFAEKLIELGHKPIIVCDQRVAEFMNGEFANIQSMQINAPKPSAGIFGKAVALFKMIPTIFHLRAEIKKLGATHAIGFGGYPSLPTMLAALSLGIGVYVHEQNSVLGKVNRLIAGFADKVFLSFPNTQKLSDAAETKSVVVGNILRKQITNVSSRKPRKSADKLNILVTGGSQGAKILSEVVPQAVKLLALGLQEKLIINQQTRADLIDEVAKMYEGCRAQVNLKSFFDDMADKLAEADLVIARAGASSVSEIALIGKPSILIPLKIATDNHQMYNAEFLSEAGAALIISEDDLSPSKLAIDMSSILSDAEKMLKMGSYARSVGKPDAAESIAKEMNLLRVVD